MVGDFRGSIGFRWFWVAESVKVSCQLPLCAQESGWHSNRSGGKQSLSHMLCLTLRSRSNLPRAGRGHVSEGRRAQRWSRTKPFLRISQGQQAIWDQSWRQASCICAAVFQHTSLGSLTFQKPLESRNVRQSLFLKSYDVLCKCVRIQQECCHGIKCEPNGKSKSLHGKDICKNFWTHQNLSLI